MSGNAANTHIWDGADVYISTVGTTGPADLTTVWGAGWQVAGLLDGDEGFTEARSEDTSEHYAWGGILYKRTRSHHKRTIKFVALEDNAVTFDLREPGSTRTTVSGVMTSVVKVPTSAEFSIGFESRDGDHIRRRVAARASVESVGEIKTGESDPTVYEFTVVIYPETDGTLYTDIETAPSV